MASRRRQMQELEGYQFGTDRTQGPVSMLPVVAPEPNAGGDLGRHRYGGPRKKGKTYKQIEKAGEVQGTSSADNLLDVLPSEILMQAFDWLSGKDLKRVAVTSKRLSELAIRCMYSKTILRITSDSKTPTHLATEDTRKFVTAADVFRPKKAALSGVLGRFSNITKLSIDILHSSQGFQPRTSNLDATITDFVRQFGNTLLPQLMDLRIIYGGKLDELKKLLLRTTNLRRLHIAYNERADGPHLGEVLKDTVSQKLQELHFGFVQERLAPEDIVKVVDPIAHLDTFADTTAWPNLRLVEFGSIGGHRSDLRHKQAATWLPKLLQGFAEWSKTHSRWKFVIKDSLNLFNFIHLEANEVLDLMTYYEQPRKPDLGDIVVDVEDTAEFNRNRQIYENSYGVSSLVEKLRAVRDTRGSLSVRVTGGIPPGDLSSYVAENVMSLVAKKIAPLLTEVILCPRAIDKGDWLWFDGVDLEDIWQEWVKFIGGFLPLLKNVHTLRIRSNTRGGGGDVALGVFHDELAKLCKSEKLRHLDIDASALSQPETNVLGDEVEDYYEPDEPHMVIRELIWMSAPDPSTGRNDLSRNLLNLETLTLHGIFLRKKAEFDWFTSLPARLKNLTRLQVNGLVWHAGHKKLGGPDEDKYEGWEEGDDEGREAPRRQRPRDEEDRMMNQLLARFFLDNLETTMRERMGLTEEQARDNPEYQIMIMSRDAMRSELEQRAQDGTIRRQPNPFPPENPENPETDEWEDDSDDSDSDEVLSTHSDFGVDPRFSSKADQGLRERRLGDWVTKSLVASARKAGGRCTDVVIKNTRVDARGLQPWHFRAHKEDEEVLRGW